MVRRCAQVARLGRCSRAGHHACAALKEEVQLMNQNRALSKASAIKVMRPLCLILGFASIAASIAIWIVAKEPDPAHGERFGIFVGLWAPTFFTLAMQFRRPRADRPM